MQPSAARQEYVAHALEAEIRSRVKSRSWYRANRESYPWRDFERDNDLVLRLLFSIRRDGIRDYQQEQRRLERVRAAHEAAEWREAVRTGQYLPDVPVALTPDAGDHYLRPTGSAA